MWIPVFAVDEEDIELAVVVVIEQRDSRAHRFRQVFLPRLAGVLVEVDAGLLGDIRKVHRRYRGGRRRNGGNERGTRNGAGDNDNDSHLVINGMYAAPGSAALQIHLQALPCSAIRRP